MILFAVCLSLSIALMLLMERLVLPRSGARPLFHRVSLLSAMPTIIFYTTMFMISYRPVFSLAATVIALSIIIILNNVKFKALKEPLVFSDFGLLREIINHPQLYVRYIGVGNIIGVGVVLVVTILGAITLEAPVIERHTVTDYFPTAAFLWIVLGLIYAITAGPLRRTFLQLLRSFGRETDIRQDMDKLSLLACLIVYFFLANEMSDVTAPAAPPARPSRPPTKSEAPPPRRPEAESRPSPWCGATELPRSVVVIQNESFFDVRRVHPTIPSDVLSFWDRLGEQSLYRGRLSVPAWGANTMRSEFAFLSGLPNEALGVHRFNPYQQLCRQPVWTIAHHLRQLGYRTVCIHPYPADFFNRSEVFPNLGFDEFIDVASFEGAETFGPYISDNAVAEKILAVLGSCETPRFIFAITMENHGRWEKDRLDNVLPRPVLEERLGSPELAIYLHHIANADRMLETLVTELNRLPGDAVLSMFGDHVPSLPKLFDAVEFTDPRTDYLVWRKQGGHPRTADVGVDVVHRLVLDAVLNQANRIVANRRPAAALPEAANRDVRAPAVASS